MAGDGTNTPTPDTHVNPGRLFMSKRKEIIIMILNERQIKIIRYGHINADTEYNERYIRNYLPQFPNMCTPEVPEAIDNGGTLTIVHFSEEEDATNTLPREIRMMLRQQRVEGSLKESVTIVTTPDNKGLRPLKQYQEYLKRIKRKKNRAINDIINRYGKFSETSYEDLLDKGDGPIIHYNLYSDDAFKQIEFELDFRKYIRGLLESDPVLFDVCDLYLTDMDRKQIAEHIHRAENTVSDYRKQAREKWNNFYK